MEPWKITDPGREYFLLFLENIKYIIYFKLNPQNLKSEFGVLLLLSEMQK